MKDSSLSASFTDNSPLASPSCSASPPSEPHKVVTCSIENEEANSRQELAQKHSELMRKREAMNGENSLYEQEMSEMEQKLDEIKETIMREKKNHELKREQCKTGVSTREAWEREDANLQQMFQLKKLELKQEAITLQLWYFQKAEMMYLRHVAFYEELEVYHRKKYAGNEAALQQMLPYSKKRKEEVQNKLQNCQESIRVLLEDELSLKRTLATIINSTDSVHKGKSERIHLSLQSITN